MQELGQKHPYAGYGGYFYTWLFASNPKPYNSWGNGAGMRVSPVGLFAKTLDEALSLAEITASVSHNHPEGVKGAQAIAASVFLCKAGKSKAEIKDFIEKFAGEFEMTEPEEFNENTQYRELEEWDSLLGLSIIGMINNNYGVKVTGEEVKNAGTILGLFKIVESRVK